MDTTQHNTTSRVKTVLTLLLFMGSVNTTQAQTDGQVLTRVGGGASWQTPVDNNTTYTAGNGITIEGTTNSIRITPTGTDNQVLTSVNGLALWRTPTDGDITRVIAGDGLTGGGTIGDVTLTVDADNGLEVDATDDRVELGGTLRQATTITLGANNMTFNTNGTNAGNFRVLDNSTEVFVIQNDGSIIANGVGADNDFSIQSDDNANMFFVDGSEDRVGIGTNAPSAPLEVAGRIAVSGLGNSVYIGTNAGLNADATNGVDNVAIGQNAFQANTTGDGNTVVGAFGLESLTTAVGNSIVGHSAASNLTTGWRNSGIGTAILKSLTTGEYNVAVGFDAAGALTTGLRNVVIGNTAMASLVQGNDNVVIGSGSDISVNNVDESVALGSGAMVSVSKKIRLGNTSVTVVEGPVGYTTSDARFKSEFQEDVPGLDFITRLRPLTYKYEAKKHQEFWKEGSSEGRDYTEIESQRQTGFVAQEMEEVLEEIGFDFNGLHSPVNEYDNYSIGYAQMVVPLVKAVQEQQVMIKELENKIRTLEQKLKN